jgi:hypothetical protein
MGDYLLLQWPQTRRGVIFYVVMGRPEISLPTLRENSNSDE